MAVDYNWTMNMWKGLYSAISASIPLAGEPVYCTDQDWFVIGDGTTSVANLKKYRVDEVDSISSNTTYTSADNKRIILVTTGSSDITVTLPSAATVEAQTYFVKKIDSGTGKVIVQATAGNIEGDSDYELTSQYDSVTVVSDASNYFIKTAPGGGGAIVEVTLAETVTALKAIAYNTSGQGILADITDSAKINVTGISLTGGSAAIECQKIGELAAASHGFTLGVQYYLGSAGNPVTRANVPGNVPTIPLFIPKDANTLDINIGQLEKRIEDIQQYPIGHITWMVDKSEAPAGYIPFEFNNAVSQSAYADLYSKIGDRYETMHTAAGDLSSGAGMFYPTPVPGAYFRAALNIDITIVTAVPASDYVTVASADYNRLNSLRGSGLPVKLTLVSGSLTAGLTADTQYFLGFATTDQITFHNTEADAITNTSPVTLTDTATGTWEFYQTGIELDFAVEEHNHQSFVDTTTTGTGSVGVAGSANASDTDTTGVDSVTDVLGANVSNETRPKTNYQYAFIKAVNIDLSSGQPVSAIKYDSGHTLISNWLNRRDTYTHNLDAKLSELIVKIFMSSDGTEANEIEVTNVNFLSSALSTEYNFQLEYNDDNSIILATGANGARYYDGTGTSVSLGSSNPFYIRLVIYKPTFTTKVYEPKVFTYDLSGGSLVHALPDASNYHGEITLRVSGGTYGVNYLTINTVGAQTIDGDSSYIIEIENTITLVSDGSNWIIKDLRIPLYIEVKHTASSGVSGGTGIAGSWQVRPLTASTLDTNIPGITVGSNTIQNVPQGKYDCEARAMFYSSVRTRIKIYNSTDAVDGPLGDSSNCNTSEAGRSIVNGKLTLSGTKDIQLLYRINTAAANSLGVASSFGDDEVYANIKMVKIA